MLITVLITAIWRKVARVNASVRQSWERIVALLQDHAPATAQVIRDPAPVADARRLQEVVSLDLPADLLEWWAVMDGVDDERDYRAGGLIPNHYMPLAVARAQEEYLRIVRASALDPDCCDDKAHRKEAGSTGFPFCTALVPICRDVGGGLLCVDLRPGEDHGRVMKWEAEEGFYPSEWLGVAEMLAEVAERLDEYAQGHEPAPFEQPLAVVDGIVQWWP